MGIFRRRSGESGRAVAQTEVIDAFWAWWRAEGSRATAAAIGGSEPEVMIAELGRRVKLIDPDLAWELAPGSMSAHMLVVSPEGDDRLRGLARRWLRSAPEPDFVWSYQDSRPGHPNPEGSTLEVAGATLDVASATVGAHVRGTAVDVAVHHPAFATMKEGARLEAALLLLDLVLGEAAVQSWIGEISATAHPSLDPVPLPGLASVVQELRERHTDPDGEPRWIVLSGTTADGGPMLAGTQVPLRPASAPQLDTYLGIAVPYPGPGLPGEAELAALGQLEDQISQVLAGDGRVVAHQTHAGVRVLHIYADSTTDVVARMRELAGVRIEVTADPAWERVQHLR